MKLDFPNMQETENLHFKGGEGVTYTKMYFDGLNRIVQCRLPKGSSIGQHTHDTSSEIIYIIAGKAQIILDGEEDILTPGQCHYCPKGHTHTTISIGDEDLILLGVVPEQ